MTGSPGTGNPESESQFNFKPISLFTRKSSYLEQSLICVNSSKCSLHPRPKPSQKPNCTVCDYLSDFTTYHIISEVVAEENHKISSGCNPATMYHICLDFNWLVLFKGPLFYAFDIYFSSQTQFFSVTSLTIGSVLRCSPSNTMTEAGICD